MCEIGTTDPAQERCWPAKKTRVDSKSRDFTLIKVGHKQIFAEQIHTHEDGSAGQTKEGMPNLCQSAFGTYFESGDVVPVDLAVKELSVRISRWLENPGFWGASTPAFAETTKTHRY